MATKKINGQLIDQLYPIGSWYHNGCIAGVARVDGQKMYFRLPVTEVAKMVGDFNFNIDYGEKDARRRHVYLEVAESVYDDDCEVSPESRELILEEQEEVSNG